MAQLQLVWAFAGGTVFGAALALGIFWIITHKFYGEDPGDDEKG
jgi:hypothetical protein